MEISSTQIMLCATGYHASIEDYKASAACLADNPAHIILRSGKVLERQGNGGVVAIENVGPLAREEGRWKPAYRDSDGHYVPVEGVRQHFIPYEYCSRSKYRGCQFYEYVGDMQLRSLRSLLVQLLQERQISFPYDNQLGQVSPRALAGGSGIYFASSYLDGRSDLHPQIEVLRIIKSLAS